MRKQHVPNRLIDIMDDYFDADPPSSSVLPYHNLLKESVGAPEFPVCPVQTNTWEVVSDPNRLMRTFEFETAEELFSFLNEVLVYQEESQHHGKITVDHRKVIIEVYTHDVNDVTEVDKEYAQVVDNILQDVKYFEDQPSEDNYLGGY
jgi:4a-hydroxytetrahydrobiopterin dehydratase